MATAKVSSVVFVQAVLASGSFEELATKVNMTSGSARAKYDKLVKMGVNLPKYEKKNRGEVIDIGALNAPGGTIGQAGNVQAERRKRVMF